MNAWLNDPATANLPNHDNGSFSNSTMDPSMAFLQSPNPSDPNSFQRMFNGASRNMSPGFHNPNPVIPSKRSRPEDGFSMSPRQAPGALPGSRSQTPQMPFPGYQDAANGASQFPQPAAPTPYQHLQAGSNNASPSPILPEFDQGAQRVQTASPSPFSPAGVHVGSQISPAQSDQGSRVNTPQNSTFGQQPFPQPSPSHFPSSAALPSSGMHPALQAQYGQGNPAVMAGFSPQQIAQQQRMYQMQLQNQARQLHQANAAAATARPAGTGVNPMSNPQVAAMRNMQQNMAKPTSPEGFLRVLQRFMMTRNLPLDINPIVSGRPLNLMQLYATVMKFGGSKKISAMNNWPAVAQHLQFPAMQYPTAAQEIRDHYLRNLGPYEQAWVQKQYSEQAQGGHQRHPGDGSAVAPPIPPNKSINSPAFDLSPHHPLAGQPMQQNNAQIPMNGYATAQQKPIPKQQRVGHQHRSSLSRPPESASPNGQVLFSPSAAIPHDKQSSPASTRKTGGDFVPSQQPIEDPFKPAVLPGSNLHGPIAIDEAFQVGDELMRLKPTVPTFAELGVIDIHALTMSIKSGIRAEMRLALDTLTEISFEPAVQISLDNCGDLVEGLVDCAEEQLELLADNAAEVSDEIQLSSYEETLRSCRQEMETLLDVPEFGSLDYDLDRAVDRLICITTIIRNFSFTESNFTLLSMPFVVKFFSTAIRYLGTRHVFLRTNQNTLDFMKDTVIYLSNLSHAIQLPGHDEALSILHFLTSFGPISPPSFGSDGIMFAAYEPSIHRYLPAAVDSLAKLFARDDPNRTYFKAIFAQESSPSSPNGLLSRSFALSIAPIPGHTKGNVVAVADARKAFLMQGLLAAELLAGMADNHTARSWLQSVDGFASSLLRLACLLSADRNQPGPQRHGAARAAEADFHWHSTISNRALCVLSRLAEKSKRVDGVGASLGVLPKKENLLGALLTPNIDPNVVRQLCQYAGLGE